MPDTEPTITQATITAEMVIASAKKRHDLLTPGLYLGRSETQLYCCAVGEMALMTGYEPADDTWKPALYRPRTAPAALSQFSDDTPMWRWLEHQGFSTQFVSGADDGFEHPNATAYRSDPPDYRAGLALGVAIRRQWDAEHLTMECGA